MQFTLATVAAFAALISSSAAHLIMAEPPQWAVPGESQGPLDPSGSDFPCQNGTPDPVAARTYTPGSKATLQIQGTAVHGGGSGQMLITYDFPPNSSSVWRVMQSFSGDHPIRALEGNMNNVDSRIAPSAGYMLPELKWDVPSGLPSGKAVVAWSWYNRMGNREHYMKCATVQIDGTNSTSSNLNEDAGVRALPTMFRANSGNGCTVDENIDFIKFKNPGPNPIEHYGPDKNGAQYVPTPVSCDSSVAGSDSDSDSNSGSPAAEPSSSAELPAPTATGPPYPEDDTENESANGDEEELPATPSEGTNEPLPSEPVVKEPVVKEPVTKQPVTKQPEEPVDNTPEEETPANGAACPEGKYYCNGDSWSQCGSGYIQDMGKIPAGLQCKDGVFSPISKKTRRAIRFSPEHMRRRH